MCFFSFSINYNTLESLNEMFINLKITTFLLIFFFFCIIIFSVSKIIIQYELQNVHFDHRLDPENIRPCRILFK